MTGIRELGWLGVRTERFDATVALYRDVLGLDPFAADEESVRFRLGDGTEVHVYGPRDTFHAFFGTAPVVGLVVDDLAVASAAVTAAGLELLTEAQRSETERWVHFRGPDGNVYELIERG